jgi:hypothetical protein
VIGAKAAGERESFIPVRESVQKDECQNMSQTHTDTRMRDECRERDGRIRSEGREDVEEMESDLLACRGGERKVRRREDEDDEIDPDISDGERVQVTPCNTT